jgi:hypothetical protein
MGYSCCHCGSSESLAIAPRLIPNNEPQDVPNDVPQIISNDAPPVILDNKPQDISHTSVQDVPHDAFQNILDEAPILRICFAVRTLGILGIRWKCREYQIRFRDFFTWRCVFDFDQLPNMPLELDSGSSRAVKSESHWSLSTTDSAFSLETVRASKKSRSKKNSSTKTSTCDSVQTTRLKSKQTDSLKQTQQPPTYSQSQEQYASCSSAEDAEEEKRRRHKEALEQLEAKNSQSQPGTLKHQEWSRLRMLIANGLDAEARRHFPQVAEGQEALLWPIEQDGNYFEVNMRTLRASDIEDAKVALEQIEDWKWKNAVIFVRDGETPLEQTEWRIMEKPRALDWAPYEI